MFRYKLITFDITGTILKFKHTPGVHYAKVGAKFGINVAPDVLNTSFKRQWKHLNSSQPNFGLRHNGWEKWWVDAVKRTFIDAGIDNDKHNIILDDVAKCLIDKFTTSKCWQHCDGAIDLLTKLKSKNVPVGVVSNFDSRLDQILENMNVRQYFDFVVTSYAAGHTKPDPRIFEEALKNSNMSIHPRDILHVGDTKELDYDGATRAGWNSWLITSNCDVKNNMQSSGTLHHLQKHLFQP